MATKEALRLDVALHMNGGLGDKNYANNSLLQKKVLLKAKPMLEESIKRVYFAILPSCLKVADLGCSSGPNALYVMSEIINIIDTTSSNLNLKLPVFQYFLNDLFGNDFNTIFESLPQFLEALEEKKGNKFGPCFINATPGSYFKRLFPTDSMHFFHSSYSLHWLSRVPEELLGNKDNIHLTKESPPAMHKAYAGQFQRDFKWFLKFRSEELVPGGGMVLTLVGREESCEILRTSYGLISMTLKDMIFENLIEEAKLESFNLPLYDPTIEEVKQVIEEEGSFSLHRLDTFKMGWDANINDEDDNKLDENMRAEFIAKYCRAGLESLFKAHFGEGILDELFLRFKHKLAHFIMHAHKLEFPNLLISLMRN